MQRSELHVRSADPSSCGGSASHNHSKNSVSVLQKAAVQVKLRRLGGGGSTLLHLFVLLVKGTCSQQHGWAADLAPVSRADWSEEERISRSSSARNRFWWNPEACFMPCLSCEVTVRGDRCSRGRERNAVFSGSISELLSAAV